VAAEYFGDMPWVDKQRGRGGGSSCKGRFEPPIPFPVRKFWSRLMFGRPDSSRATISPSTTVSSGSSPRASTRYGYCRLKDLRRRENRLTPRLDDGDSAIAIEFDFVDPSRPVEQLCDGRTIHRLNEFSFSLWKGC